MSCIVKLFEPNSASPPVHIDLKASRIELVAVDETTKVNCCNVETNKALSGRYKTRHGADLQFNKDSFIYQVAISDSLGVYGGTTISSLTGTTDGDLDVVLEKLPQGTHARGAAGATNAAQARQAVLSDPVWTVGEKRAVFSVMNALVSLRGTSAPALLSFIRNYTEILRNRGIDANLF
jgi:hypothetical protein